MTAVKKKRAKKKKSAPFSLEFEIMDHSVSVGIQLKDPGTEFKDLAEDDKIWEQAAHIKCSGKRIDHEEEKLILAVSVSDHPKLFEETKADYAIWIEGDKHWHLERKTRTRRGKVEFLYRDFNGFGYCYKGKYDNAEQYWDFMVHLTPAYATQVLHLLAMDKRAFMTTYVLKLNRYYSILRIDFTNDAEDVIGPESVFDGGTPRVWGDRRLEANFGTFLGPSC